MGSVMVIVGPWVGEDHKATSQWDSCPQMFPDGSAVSVHYGIHTKPGQILRRGHGPYGNQYRVLFQSGGDQWVDCWRCRPFAS